MPWHCRRDGGCRAGILRRGCFRWKIVEGASGYQIARSVYKTRNYSIVKTVNDKYIGYKIDTKKNKTYYYKVRAYKIVNGKKTYAPWSNYKSFRLK